MINFESTGEFVTGGGTNKILLKNTEGGGATIDQTESSSRITTNEITGYDPLVNFIEVSERTLSHLTARFVDGQLVTRFDNTRNTFVRSGNSSVDGGGGEEESTSLAELLDISIDDLVIDREEDGVDFEFDSRAELQKTADVIAVESDLDARSKKK